MEEASDPDATNEREPGVGAMPYVGALDGLLQGAVLLARDTVPDAHSVSITVTDADRYRTSNFTAEEAMVIDQAQYDGGEGPCLEALRSTQQVQVAVGADRDRWPRFEMAAEEVGVTAVLSTPLVRVPGEAVGALNIYGRQDGAFGKAALRTAEAIAEHVAVLVGNAAALLSATYLNEQLRHAVASREIIGEAKGIIMERQSCTRDEAFEILRRASQRENRKLRELAEEFVLRVEARAGERPPRR